MVLHTQILTILRTPVLGVKMVFNKSLKIPKAQSESVYRRRTDKTMTKRKKDKQRSTKHTYKN